MPNWEYVRQISLVEVSYYFNLNKTYIFMFNDLILNRVTKSLIARSPYNMVSDGLLFMAWCSISMVVGKSI